MEARGAVCCPATSEECGRSSARLLPEPITPHESRSYRAADYRALAEVVARRNAGGVDWLVTRRRRSTIGESPLDSVVLRGRAQGGDPADGAEKGWEPVGGCSGDE